MRLETVIRHGEDGFAGMRNAGRLAAAVLDMITPHVVAGVTTDELDIYDPVLQHVYGDDWQVVSLGKRIPAGTEVKVVNVNGTKLEVQTLEI